jgi:hypothetical protein
MENIEIGTMATQPGGFKAFIPNPFPPENGFDFDPSILKNNNEATRRSASAPLKAPHGYFPGFTASQL